MATVYSTDLGKICSICNRSEQNCTCSAKEKRRNKNSQDAKVNNSPCVNDPNDGIVRIRLEKKGRGGKSVTTVNGLPGNEKELKTLAKKIKAKLGTGGAIKQNIVEFQGDRRTEVQKHLESLNFRVKQVGG